MTERSGYVARLRAGVAAACLGLVGAPIAAQGSDQGTDGVLYDCDITERAAGVDWISPKVAFVVQGGAVTVIDAIILDFEGTPVAAQVRQRGEVMVLHWTVLASDSQNNRARLSYRADLDTAAKTVRVRISPVGYPQSWSGSGTCQTRTP